MTATTPVRIATSMSLAARPSRASPPKWRTSFTPPAHQSPSDLAECPGSSTSTRCWHGRPASTLSLGPLEPPPIPVSDQLLLKLGEAAASRASRPGRRARRHCHRGPRTPPRQDALHQAAKGSRVWPARIWWDGVRHAAPRQAIQLHFNYTSTKGLCRLSFRAGGTAPEGPGTPQVTDFSGLAWPWTPPEVRWTPRGA